MAEVHLDNVGKVYRGGVTAVSDVSFAVPDGGFCVLVGPSGCGKSTLLRMVAGLEEITAGKVSIGARVVNDLEPMDRDIAMVFQNYALYPHMNVFDNMAYGLRNRKVDEAEVASRVAEAARILELEPYLKRKPRELSGGQRQRVAIARALILQPGLLLLDEPTSALDVSVQAEVLNLLSELRRQHGLTYLLVSHDLGVVAHLCDRLAVMQQGAIVETLSTDALCAGAARHPYTRTLMASAEA
jgi:sn-glycerol 3-phosphate transport system ATP-binding protein